MFKLIVKITKNLKDYPDFVKFYNKSNYCEFKMATTISFNFTAR